jgi:hypothetical protein
LIRWLRIVAIGTVLVSMIGLGIVIGLFLIANSGWVQVNMPPWLTGLFGDPRLEVRAPVLLAGWLAFIVALMFGSAWSMFYVWRRRQYEGLIRRLERELAALRNLPFTHPAPLEDVPESPDPRAARLLAELSEAEGRGALPATAPEEDESAVEDPNGAREAGRLSAGRARER